MKAALTTTMVTGCVLIAALAAGCSRAPSRPHRATVQSCTRYGIYAIQHHITVKWQPSACRGLSKAQINFAVGRAIYSVAGSGRRKAAWRTRARAAGALLAHMVSAVPRPSPAAAAAGTPSARGGPAARRGGTTGIAALLTWLIAVGSGGYMLVRWIVHGGVRRRRARGGGLSPMVIFSHFGLATAGLLAWIIFLTTGTAGAAWAAVGLLLPVAGLGMTLVTLSAPARFLAAPAVDRVPVGAGGPAAPDPAPAPSPRSRVYVWVIAGHGVAATATILLALLAALGTR